MTHRNRRPPLLAAALAGVALSAAIVQHQAVPRVVDGDTIDWGWRLKIESARYRLAGIDTPETRGARCAEERALGKQAAERLRSLVAAGDVTLRVDDASDKYRRQIASLSHGGHDVGETLISEGLARPYSGRGKRGSWCGVLDLSSKP